MNDDKLIKGFIPALKSWVNDTLYDFKQKFILYRAITTNLDLKNIANPNIPAKEMESLLDEQLDMVKNLEINHNLDPSKYDLKQLQELDRALNQGLDISHYKDPAFSADQMYLATTFQEGGIDGLTDIKPTWSTDDILALRAENLNIAHHQENRIIPTLEQMDSPDGLSLTELQGLIRNGADVNELINGDPPILLSSYDDDPAKALLLLRNGANVEHRGDLDQTALTASRSPEMAKLLIEHGANINHVNGIYNDTALTHATSGLRIEDRLGLVTLLLEHGANPNHQNETGNTALHGLENKPDNIEIAKKLIEHGANPEIVNEDNERPKIMDEPELQKFLETFESQKPEIEGKALTERLSNYGITPDKYNVEQMQELDEALEKGLDISHYKDPAFSADQMYLATTFQEGGIDQMEKIKPEMSTNEIINLRTVRICMANGMENLPTLDKLDTPEGLTLKELQNLIIHGADVNKSIDNDENQVSFAPLEIIAYKNNTAEALLLLRNGADVAYSGESGETALTVTRSPEMAKLLIEHGANINHVNDRGETALTNAVQGYRVIDQLELVTVLLEKGADPNNKNIFGNTPLHDLNQNSDNDIEIAKKLIEHGANPEIVNEDNERPKIMGAPELQKFLETQADLPPWENSKFYKHQDQSRDYVMSDKSTGKHIFLNSNEEVFELLAKHDPDGIIDKLRTTGKLELSNGETLDLTVDSPEKVGDSLAQELNIPHITVEDKRTAECLQHDSGMEID